MFRIAQIILGVLGILLALGSDRFSMPMLMTGGIACFGLFAMSVGGEAIITRHIVIGSRRRGTRQTYTGLPAVLQGLQFNLIGLFLLGLSIFAYVSNEGLGRDIFLQFVRRPGWPLAVIGGLLLLQSLVMFLGYREINEGSDWMVRLNLVFSRMMPGMILFVLGLGALGLGLLDMVAPALFDSMGGEFLETLYEVG